MYNLHNHYTTAADTATVSLGTHGRQVCTKTLLGGSALRDYELGGIFEAKF
ncbi:hypothetical protein DPMN_036717 [Dreissena polymorpha]|uniref:Uncharacterized protein n=1 Tax=Dreissena polymorpha TaxID=45954 RepID=A0A9D4RP35_DREPO|nr:hypothetical protein DPMN_036717 [Dreissena polymorpha]